MWKCSICAAFAVCVLVHSQETKNADKMSTSGPGDRLLETNAGNTSFHVHDSGNNTSSEENYKREESEFFLAALFKKYNSSTTLTLDGFARLVCRLGLVPTPLTENTKVADDTKDACEGITFEKLQKVFEAYAAAEEAEHGEGSDSHEHSEHSDSHADHDHQPNRNGGSADNHTHYGDHDHDPAEDGDVHDHSNHVHDNPAGTVSDHSKAQNHSIAVSDSAPQPSPKVRRRRRDVDAKTSSTQSPTAVQETLVHFHVNHSKCPSPGELLQQFHIPQNVISPADFMLLCPALIYQLDSGACQHHHHDEVVSEATYEGIPPKVWGFSIAAVMVISLAGLLGVAVIPIMQKVFYNHLLQFLVAVAVGALSGDALLHLLPHAISKNLSVDHPHSHANVHTHEGEEADLSEHLQSVWKGLVALLCIFFFFIMERILTIVTEKKRRQKSMNRLKKRHCEQLCSAEKGGGVGAKLAAQSNDDYTHCDQMVMVVHPNRALKGYADATHDVLMHQCDEAMSQAEHAFETEDTDTDNLNHAHTPLGHSHHSNSHSHHNHSHGHAHCDTMPASVAAVAWMVILGDGIHNFSDGLAIGAAFANSVTGGISTSIAVLCHELPHEIGDFAVLMRAGMSVKQAIVYNCVSSVLCLFGMLVGVAMGNIHDASLWIFAGVGGMFLYISMVDMLPEMTAVDTKKGENQYLHLLLQVAGMLLGSGIMLLVAVYEHDLQQMVG